MFNIKETFATSGVSLMITILFFVFCGGEGTPDYCGDGHPLNSTTQFCFGNETFDKCGGNTYDPTEKFCHDDILFDRCEGGIYNPAERFCHGNVQYPICEGVDYDPTTHGCHFDVLRPRCGIYFYDPEIQFCHSNNVHGLCDGETYTPPNNPCDDGAVIIRRFDLTVNANPSVGGTVSPTGTTPRDSGATVTVTATENVGYEFRGWSVMPQNSNVNTNDLTITFNINSNITLTANFREVISDVGRPPERYTIISDINPTGGGEITITPPNQTTYEEGTEVTLTATPSAGYEFVNWSGNLPSPNPTISFEINSNMNMTANFRRIVYTLSTNISPLGAGTVTLEPNKSTYDVGEIVTITATPASGYHFTGWSGASTSEDSPTTITMDDNKTLTANFARIIGFKSTFVDPRDNQTYNTVVMPDGKIWMAQNLNFAMSGEPSCYHNQMPNYGRFYDWNTAMTVCPAGWHLPSRVEWETLVNAVGSNAGTKLKSSTDWAEHSDTPVGTNDFGFSALPGGHCWNINNGSFAEVGTHGHWWTATENSSTYARVAFMVYNSEDVTVGVGESPKGVGVSVRCVRD